MHCQIEAAVRSTLRWIVSAHCAAPVPAAVWTVVEEADAALSMLAGATAAQRAKWIREGFGVETLKDLQFAVADAGLWAAYAKGAPSLGSRAYDVSEGLALAAAA